MKNKHHQFRADQEFGVWVMGGFVFLASLLFLQFMEFSVMDRDTISDQNKPIREFVLNLQKH